jgi:hypothetical protein
VGVDALPEHWGPAGHHKRSWTHPCSCPVCIGEFREGAGRVDKVGGEGGVSKGRAGVPLLNL